MCEARAWTSSFAPGVDEVYPPGLRHHRHRRRDRASRSRARPGRATSTASRPLSRSSSGWSAPTGPTSGRRTAQQVCGHPSAWHATSRSRREVVACPTVRERGRPGADVVAQRPPDPGERAAAPVLRRALVAAREAWAGRRAFGRDPPRGDAGRLSRARPLATSSTSRVRRRRTRCASSTTSTARRCCRWRSASGRSGSSTTRCSSAQAPLDADAGRGRAAPGLRFRRSPGSGGASGCSCTQAGFDARCASVATARIRSMSRCSATSALISSIFSKSAGCVLTSRSWTSDATW